MNNQRRDTLKAGGVVGFLLASGLLGTGTASAATRPTAAFDAKNVADALKALGVQATDSTQIQIQSPEIAENGAVVPVGVSSSLPKTQEMYVLIEKNPNPMGAGFIIPDGTEPSVQTRVKMSQSSNIVAIVKADGKWYSTIRETKVTLGGCGG